MLTETVRLADVTTRIGSGITPRGGSAVYKTSGRPFVRSQNVGWGDLRLDDLAFLDEATHSTFTGSEIRVGDVLLNITGASIGRSAVAIPALDGGNVNQHVCEVRLKSSMNPDFVCAVLNSQIGQRQIDTFQAGGNRQGLNFKQVGSIRVPRLGISDQNAVASAINHTDDLIASLRRLIAKKRAVKQGMMQELLTGRTRLPGFDENLSKIQLGDVATFSKGAGLPKSLVATVGDFQCVHYGELFLQYAPVAEHTISRTDWNGHAKSQSGDVLMPTSDVTPKGLAKATALLSSGVVLGGDILVIRADKRHLDSAYLAYAIRNDAKQVLNMVRGSTVYHLYARDMRRFELAVPSLQEQQMIARILHDADTEISALERRLEATRDIKQGMMQELLTGRTRFPIGEEVAV